MSIVEENRKREKTGGRSVGTPNKFTASIKDMIVQALDESGGVAYLVEQAKENPNAFLTLIGKVLPTQISGVGENGEHVIKHIAVSFIDASKD